MWQFNFMTISVFIFILFLREKYCIQMMRQLPCNSSKEIGDFRAKYGEEPLWTNSMFSGMPAYLIQCYIKGTL